MKLLILILISILLSSLTGRICFRLRDYLYPHIVHSAESIFKLVEDICEPLENSAKSRNYFCCDKEEYF